MFGESPVNKFEILPKTIRKQKFGLKTGNFNQDLKAHTRLMFLLDNF